MSLTKTLSCREKHNRHATFLTKKEDKPESNYVSDTFSTKNDVLYKIVAFWNLFRDRDDYVNTWIVKITIKTNHIVCLFASLKIDSAQKPRLSLKSGFLHNFIVW